jgi:Pterin binding enzyme
MNNLLVHTQYVSAIGSNNWDGVVFNSDISAYLGGRHDSAMLETVAELGVPIVMMHMRGTSQTMTSKEHCTYATGDCIAEIATGSCCGLTRYIQRTSTTSTNSNREGERREEMLLSNCLVWSH